MLQNNRLFATTNESRLSGRSKVSIFIHFINNILQLVFDQSLPHLGTKEVKPNRFLFERAIKKLKE